MAPVSVVTGANRGIGLSLCQKLKSKGYTVIATCRKPTPELQALGVSIVEGVDVGREGGCTNLTASLASQTVDLLVCNAGVLLEDSLADIDMDALRQQFEVNALGPLRTFLAVKDRLAKGAKVAIITSRMGSIADNGSGGDRRLNSGYSLDAVNASVKASGLARPDTKSSVRHSVAFSYRLRMRLLGSASSAPSIKTYGRNLRRWFQTAARSYPYTQYGYRMSKAAVNMLGANLAVDLKSEGISVGILHPGFVATDMTKKYHGMDGVISPDQSAGDLVAIIETQLNPTTSGTFWHRNGTVLPW